MNKEISVNEDFRHDVKTSLLFNDKGFYIEVKYGKYDMPMISQYISDIKKASLLYIFIINNIIADYVSERDIVTILTHTDEVVDYIKQGW